MSRQSAPGALRLPRLAGCLSGEGLVSAARSCSLSGRLYSACSGETGRFCGRRGRRACFCCVGCIGCVLADAAPASPTNADSAATADQRRFFRNTSVIGILFALGYFG
ncbi:hypothetical protein DM75_3530 [Burkholderia mallei]|nr:hypothetical protein DM75_3530 [Burkholderia mallei]